MHLKKALLKEALSLPPIERATLIKKLLASFDFPDRDRIDRLWASEAEDRIDAYERGELSTSPLESVLAIMADRSK